MVVLRNIVRSVMLKPLTSVENVSPTSRIIEAIASALARVSRRAIQRDQQILLESVLLEPKIQCEAAGNKAPATPPNVSMMLNQFHNIAIHHKSKNAQKEHKANLNEPLLYRYAEITAQNAFDREH